MKSIVINRMYTGSYLLSNLGHEVINMFQADNSKHYLYLNARGNFSKEGMKVGYMLLVMYLSNKRIEVIGLAKNLIPIESANCTLPNEINEIRNELSKKQKEYIYGEKKTIDENGGIHYGDKCLLDIFNDAEQQNIFVSYETESGNFFVPRNRIILCFDENSKQDGDILMTQHNFSSTSLKQYIHPGNDDYDTLLQLINDSEKWNLSKDKVSVNNYSKPKNISLLDICKLNKNENCFSNALEYFMLKYPKLWSDFFNAKVDSLNFKPMFSVKREVVAKVNDEDLKELTGGRVDLLLNDGETYIIIENKIKSGINTIALDAKKNITQLDRYKNYIEYLLNNKIESDKHSRYKAFLLAPDYNMPDIEDSGYISLRYSEICNFLEGCDEVLQDKEFFAFYNAMKRHSFNSESESMYADMREMFYDRIFKSETLV